MLLTAFPDLRDMRVLDLGGTATAWRPSPDRPYSCPVRPAHVTVVNYDEDDVQVYGAESEVQDESLSIVVGDACDASAALTSAGVRTDFDLIYSNSLIEHVGGHSRRLELVKEIRRLGPKHWVQVPYQYFPIEPHWLFPGMQFMPTNVRIKIARNWPLAPNSLDPESAHEFVLSTELLSFTEMQGYFPDSKILRENFLGMPKSIIAVKA